MLSIPAVQMYVDNIDLAESRLINFPKFIFLCGKESTGDTTATDSRRELWLEYHNSQPNTDISIILAERVLNAFPGSSYSDLLALEEDLASFCKLTLLFAESPGSLTELGSFSVQKEFQKKLFIVFDSHHKDIPSFIMDGPIKRLEILGDNFAPLFYNWTFIAKDNKQVLCQTTNQEYLQDLHSEVLQLILAASKKREKFSLKKTGHLMLLITDLLRVVKIATANEVFDIISSLASANNMDLAAAGIHKIRIDQLLRLLCILDLIEKNPYGRSDFYAPKNEFKYFQYSFKSSAFTKLDYIERWQTEISEHYLEHNSRKAAILRRKYAEA